METENEVQALNIMDSGVHVYLCLVKSTSVFITIEVLI